MFPDLVMGVFSTFTLQCTCIQLTDLGCGRRSVSVGAFLFFFLGGRKEKKKKRGSENVVLLSFFLPPFRGGVDFFPFSKFKLVIYRFFNIIYMYIYIYIKCLHCEFAGDVSKQPLLTVLRCVCDDV